VYSLFQVATKATPLHRSRFDIIASILIATNEKAARKTHIMYKCNLSFKQLRAYLHFLIEMRLLRSAVKDTGSYETPVCFETTKKGKVFIRAYKNLKALLAEPPDSTLPAHTMQSGFGAHQQRARAVIRAQTADGY
jgi:predicted transcriptional regulator